MEAYMRTSVSVQFFCRRVFIVTIKAWAPFSTLASELNTSHFSFEGVRPMSIRVAATPRIWRENRRLRPSFDFEIRPLSTSDNVTGTDLWKLSFWLDDSPNGDGNQMFYMEQVLSEEQAAQPLYSTENLVFSDVRIPVGGPNVPCPEGNAYYCASLQKGDRPSTRYLFLAPRRASSITRCVRAPCIPNP